MFDRCLACQGRFRPNSRLRSLHIGRRIAFATRNGRVWVVCRTCGLWNLTPLEDRWEVLEECEDLFRGGDARVTSANIGMARVSRRMELIRIGVDPIRSELANWRYGGRLLRRFSRSLVIGALGLAAAAGVVSLVGGVTGSTVVTAWIFIIVASWATGFGEVAS